MDKLDHADSDPLKALKGFTSARIAIGRTGNSIPVNELLEFKLAHAHARDAVYSELDLDKLTNDLQQFRLPVFQLHSRAAYREQYLQRPDLGRSLNDESATMLSGFPPADMVIIIADGLSATAVNQHAIAILNELVPAVLSAGLTLAPICLVKQGRVAIADDIGKALNANLSLILIGERPGLSAADSMGAYLTYAPRPGLTDESRNCISNIRPGGLNATSAAKKILYLVQEAFRRKISGVALKDNAGLLS